MNNFRPARVAAVASESRQIEASEARAVAERKASPRSALETLATRLEVSPDTLRNTLRNTVFAGCRNNEEFVALVVVANAYGLNPLTKEIYAFPAKGGGVVPMVSIDGWLRIMNDHPQFDGLEHDYHYDDKGELYGIEAIIYRRDRSHPTKIMEFMDECKRNTDPWNKSPKRMLRHRATMQCARVAFGFSSIAVEDDGSIDGEFNVVPSLPAKQTIAEELNDEIPTFDKQTGEILDSATGMTVVDEEAARELDQRSAAQQTVQDIDGPLENQPEEQAPWAAKAGAIREAILKAMSAKSLKAAEDEFLKHAAGFPDEVTRQIEAMIAEARSELMGVN